MNSDTGFSCHQLDKDDVYQIDNSKSSCALFVIQGRVNFDLGKSYEGEMEQRLMLYIPQNMKAQIESITSSRCILLFWDKHLNVCNKLFLNSLLSKENDTDIKNIILPIKSPLMNILESINLYLDARLLCRHMHSLKQQDLSWIITKEQIQSRNLLTYAIYQNDLSTGSFILVLGKALINGSRRKKRNKYRR